MSDQSLGGRLGFRRVVKLQVGGATKDQLLQMLAHHDVSLNEYARVLFDDDDFTTSSDARTVRLAIVSLPEIGLSEGGVYESILERASHLGLEPCALDMQEWRGLFHGETGRFAVVRGAAIDSEAVPGTASLVEAPVLRRVEPDAQV